MMPVLSFCSEDSGTSHIIDHEDDGEGTDE